MKRNWKALVISILIPLAVGAAAAFLTMDGMKSFETVNKPPLSPPSWVFGVAWTILYTFMGISSYLIYIAQPQRDIPTVGNQKTREKNTKENKEKRQALLTYEYQLLVNFLWPTFFFHFEWYFFSFLWLVFLWVLVAKMILEFGKISTVAAWLNVPYLLWLSFAGYLNLGIWLLN